MSSAATPGPEVETADDLYRALTTMDWWVVEENRPSSAAFKQPDFSTVVASLIASWQETLSRFDDGCGVVSFNYGVAKGIGFLARIEPDPENSGNKAHANVYNPNAANKRKTMAQKLAQKCLVLQAPTFGT
jgi:hypothetical protein